MVASKVPSMLSSVTSFLQSARSDLSLKAIIVRGMHRGRWERMTCVSGATLRVHHMTAVVVKLLLQALHCHILALQTTPFAILEVLDVNSQHKLRCLMHVSWSVKLHVPACRHAIVVESILPRQCLYWKARIGEARKTLPGGEEVIWRWSNLVLDSHVVSLAPHEGVCFTLLLTADGSVYLVHAHVFFV